MNGVEISGDKMRNGRVIIIMTIHFRKGLQQEHKSGRKHNDDRDNSQRIAKMTSQTAKRELCIHIISEGYNKLLVPSRRIRATEHEGAKVSKEENIINMRRNESIAKQICVPTHRE